MIDIGICDLLPMISLHQKLMQRCWGRLACFPNPKSISSLKDLLHCLQKLKKVGLRFLTSLRTFTPKSSTNWQRLMETLVKKYTLHARETIRYWLLCSSFLKMKFKKSSNLSKRYLSSIWLWQIGIKISCYQDTLICKSPCHLPLGCGFLPMRKFSPMRYFYSIPFTPFVTKIHSGVLLATAVPSR